MKGRGKGTFIREREEKVRREICDPMRHLFRGKFITSLNFEPELFSVSSSVGFRSLSWFCVVRTLCRMYTDSLN